jgi:hypothetical protein
MASAARITADRLNVQENAGHRTRCGGARSGIRLRSLATPRPAASGEILRESRYWEIKADLSNEINKLDGVGKPILGWREPI